MTKLEIVYKKPEEITPYPENSRTHSDAQIQQLKNSIEAFGMCTPIGLHTGQIVYGHARFTALLELGYTEIPTVDLSHLSEDEKRAYIIADNKLALNAGWDTTKLLAELDFLANQDFDLDLTGFDAHEIELLHPEIIPTEFEEDEIPEVGAVEDAITQRGDVWLLGSHRVMNGDSTSVTDLDGLMNGEKAQLLHADPPYGMGKEKDGVENDNLYKHKLDDFQMEWWGACRTFVHDNSSTYIWGNAPELWRLWYSRLEKSENLYFCNQIVWDKKTVPGMKSEGLLEYPTTTEHCLFFKCGQQFIGNLNSCDYFEGWDPIRLYLKAQADACGLTPAKSKAATGVQMYSHWFSTSQWSMIARDHYQKLAEAYPGCFTRPYEDLRKEYDAIKGNARSHHNSVQGVGRSYFDNAHDIMRDIWEFERVVGEERHGHATPKPVKMMQRVMKSSLPPGALCLEPFGGSGSTLMGAEVTGRRCFTMELSPNYCDVMVRRWQNHTKKKAVLESTGEPFPDDALGVDPDEHE